MANNRNEVTGWVGWVYFAGFMMLIIGILQMISGLAALLNDTYFVATPSHLLVFDYTTWGWVHLVMGLVIMLAGSAVINGRTWGRIVAILLAVGSIIANFAFLSAYPVWSVIVIAIDVLIIFALTVHGAETELTA